MDFWDFLASNAKVGRRVDESESLTSYDANYT